MDGSEMEDDCGAMPVIDPDPPALGVSDVVLGPF